jgi:cation:H+ antiporter
MLLELGWILLGLVLLYFGAEGLVTGSARLALRLGLAPLVVGLTVVAYGTSAPEFVVSVKASLAGQSDLAVGNVVGSNIFNIAVVLGLASLVRPATANSQILKREIPIMIGVTALPVLLLADGRLERWEGGVLLVGLVAYTAFTLVEAKRQRADRLAEDYAGELKPPEGRALWDWVRVVVGVGVLVVGGTFFVDGSVGLARRFGLSEAVIGLTIIAAGTSLPELATSLVAAWKKESEIAVGNVVGSNLFNVLGILGGATTLRPAGATGVTGVDLGVMLAFAVVLLPLMWTGYRLARGEAALLVAGYVGYVAYLLSGT